MRPFAPEERRHLKSAAIFLGFFALVSASINGYAEYRYAVTAATWPQVVATVLPADGYAYCGRLLRWSCGRYRIQYRYDGVDHETFGTHSKNVERSPLLLKVNPDRPTQALLPPEIERGRNLLGLGVIAAAMAVVVFAARIGREGDGRTDEKQNHRPKRR